MRPEEMRIEADCFEPDREQSSILPSRHAAIATTAAAEEELSGLLPARLDVVVYRLTRLLRELEPHWSPCLLLTHRRSLDSVAAGCHVFDPQRGHIAAPKL